ncbi:THO complex subunit 2 [Datura stramonium]|uniref:THO complex subunit 2 n=1 Tax=Datura stramonium TaxID=4076 RepID=A0ABS8RRV8_DATST|nr:THO complex subunit 2 [Datura stramonium]
MSLSPLEYLYFTEDSIKELKNGNTSFKFSEPVPTLRFLYELCWVMVRGELPFPKCKMALECVEFVDYASQEELGSSLADIVTQLAQDLSLPGENRQRVNKLLSIVPSKFKLSLLPKLGNIGDSPCFNFAYLLNGVRFIAKSIFVSCFIIKGDDECEQGNVTP